VPGLTIAAYCNLPHPGRPAQSDWCWGPPSIEGGLGGSEEAVVYLCRELARLGHDVTVFNPCGPMSGVHDGVRYRPLEEWRPDEPRDVVVAWRRFLFIEQQVAARCKVLWLHDAPEIPDWLRALPGGEAYVATLAQMDAAVDLVCVLSRYHASLLPAAMPPSKLFLTRNGVHAPEFEDRALEAIERNPRRVLYAVSYARGLEHLLRMWPRVIARVPEAELHVFYGWHSVYDEDQRARLRELLVQPRVHEHGEIGHAALAREYRRAGIFAYPSDTPEMFSIATVKAQAARCVPIVTAQGALSEVTRAGVVIAGRAGSSPTDAMFEAELIRLLEQPDAQERLRDELAQIPVDTWSWRGVAAEWDEVLRRHLESKEGRVHD
jgi:glycosyltransferase involved in cell wall biosynthesis